jgi:hypothetical protein
MIMTPQKTALRNEMDMLDDLNKKVIVNRRLDCNIIVARRGSTIPQYLLQSPPKHNNSIAACCTGQLLLPCLPENPLQFGRFIN